MFDCSSSGGVHMHSDQVTFTAPTLMWVKVTSIYAYVTFCVCFDSYD